LALKRQPDPNAPLFGETPRAPHPSSASCSIGGRPQTSIPPAAFRRTTLWGCLSFVCMNRPGIARDIRLHRAPASGFRIQRISFMLITDRGNVSEAQSSLKRVVQFLLFLLFASSCTILFAQTITIKLVNGKNGHPMSNSHVNVWVGTKRKGASVIPTNKDGIARFRLTHNDAEVDIHNHGTYSSNDVVIDPVLKFDDHLRVNVGFVVCIPNGSDYSWLSIANISTKDLLQKGIAWPNTCGKMTATPVPGELTIFVRPLNLWERMKE